MPPINHWHKFPIIAPFLQGIAIKVARGTCHNLMDPRTFVHWYHECAWEVVLGIPVSGPEWDERRSLFINKALAGLRKNHHHAARSAFNIEESAHLITGKDT